MSVKNEELNKKLMEVIESEQDEKDKEIAVKELIKQGANINWQDEKFKTPLMKSIACKNYSIAKLLIETDGIQVNVHDEYRSTALLFAAQNGNTEIVKMLLNRGAKVNAKDLFGRSAFLFAMQSGNKELATLLINNGADFKMSYSGFFGVSNISISELLSKPENKDIRDLIQKKEEEKEQERLENRKRYIEELKEETRDKETLQNTYPSKAIEAYVDLKMGTEAEIEKLDDKELDALFELYNKDKTKIIEPSQQQEISEENLKNALASETKVYVRGIENITGMEYSSARTHNERGGETEIRKIARQANQPTLTKIKGVKTGNYNRCTTMVNYGKVELFRTVGYGIIKENTDGIKIASKYDMFSDINKAADMIYRDDVRGHKELNTRENLPIKEELDSILNHWKNQEQEDLKKQGMYKQYNEVIMNVANQEVKFIYWTKDAKNSSNPTYDKLQAVYLQRKYYEKTGRVLPIYEYKRFETDYLVESKFTDNDIVNMLKEEILDAKGRALKPKYMDSDSVSFLMTFNNEISQIKNSKKILRRFVEDRLNKYSYEGNINNIWEVVNTLKYAGIIMEGQKDRKALKDKIKVVFDNLLDLGTVANFLKNRNSGARFTTGKKKSDNKDIAAVVDLLSEIQSVAKDKTMEFLNPELEQILQKKIQKITRGIKKDIILPIKLKEALHKGDIDSVLMYASKGGLEQFKELLKNETIDIKKADKDGKTVLMYAAEYDGSKVDILLKHGANVDKEDYEKKTALMYAIQEGNVSAARSLIERGADISHTNIYGKKPLEMAIESKKLPMVELLIEKGANVEQVKINNETSATILKKAYENINNNRKIAKEAKIEAKLRSDVKNILEKKGMDINDLYSGSTLLSASVSEGDMMMAKVLINMGADVNVKEADGTLPIEIAIKNNDSEMVKFLLEKGASLENVNIDEEMSPEIMKMGNRAYKKEGKTASRQATKEDNIEKVNELKREGVNVNGLEVNTLTKKDIQQIKASTDHIKSEIQSLKEMTSDTKIIKEAQKHQENTKLKKLTKEETKELTKKIIKDLKEQERKMRVEASRLKKEKERDRNLLKKTMFSKGNNKSKLKKLTKEQIKDLREHKEKIQVKTGSLEEVREKGRNLLEKTVFSKDTNRSKLKKLTKEQIEDLREHKEKIQIKREPQKQLKKDVRRDSIV